MPEDTLFAFAKTPTGRDADMDDMLRDFATFETLKTTGDTSTRDTQKMPEADFETDASFDFEDYVPGDEFFF